MTGGLFTLLPFLNPLGFDRAWGTVLGQEEGRYSGQLLHHPFSDKRGVLKGFVQEAGVNLHGSVGVGDTLSDVGFLELVHTPIVFNPNRRLFEVARQREWPIVVERKDVIYNLQMRLKDSLFGEGTEEAPHAKEHMMPSTEIRCICTKPIDQTS